MSSRASSAMADSRPPSAKSASISLSQVRFSRSRTNAASSASSSAESASAADLISARLTTPKRSVALLEKQQLVRPAHACSGFRMRTLPSAMSFLPRSMLAANSSVKLEYWKSSLRSHSRSSSTSRRGKAQIPCASSEDRSTHDTDTYAIPAGSHSMLLDGWNVLSKVVGVNTNGICLTRRFRSTQAFIVEPGTVEAANASLPGSEHRAGIFDPARARLRLLGRANPVDPVPARVGRNV